MIFGGDRSELRQMYADAWHKHCAGEVLSSLEAQIAAVVEQHPEYHQVIAEGDVETPYTAAEGRTNPYLHMGLHLALREQVSTDRPAGIAAIQRKLQHTLIDPHDAEHRMIEVLAQTLWEAQKQNSAPDEAEYLQRLRLLS